MKTLRNITILVGLSAVLFALVATGAKAQAITSTHFTGTFTLPLETHWGAVTLPAGDYTLRYGTAFSSTRLVTIAGKADGRTLGMILPESLDDASEPKDAIRCVREGNILYVSALEMPLIGESTRFKIPHGVEVQSKVVAKNHTPSGKTQLPQVAILVHGGAVK